MEKSSNAKALQELEEEDNNPILWGDVDVDADAFKNDRNSYLFTEDIKKPTEKPVT